MSKKKNNSPSLYGKTEIKGEEEITFDQAFRVYKKINKMSASWDQEALKNFCLKKMNKETGTKEKFFECFNKF